MEISKDMKKYVLVAIAGIAIAAYVVPTTGWLDLNAAFAGGNGHDNGGSTECEGGDGGNGGNGGVAISSISQSVSQDDTDGDEYGNTATLVNTGDAEADGRAPLPLGALARRAHPLRADGGVQNGGKRPAFGRRRARVEYFRAALRGAAGNRRGSSKNFP